MLHHLQDARDEGMEFHEKRRLGVYGAATFWVNLAYTCVKPLERLYVCQGFGSIWGRLGVDLGSIRSGFRVETDLHKKQPYTRISPTQESNLHKNPKSRVEKKVGGTAGATVGPQVPLASGASSMRRDLACVEKVCTYKRIW